MTDAVRVVFIADRVGQKPTHLARIEAGRITAIRATCGGRRSADLADPSGAIRRGDFMGRALNGAAATLFVAGSRWFAAPTLRRLDELLVQHGAGGVAHRRCVEAFNSTIACGTDHGDCGHPACCLSEQHRPTSIGADWTALNGIAAE